MLYSHRVCIHTCTPLLLTFKNSYMSKRAVIKNKKTAIKVVIHPIKKGKLSAALVDHILNSYGWVKKDIQIKFLTNSN